MSWQRQNAGRLIRIGYSVFSNRDVLKPQHKQLKYNSRSVGNIVYKRPWLLEKVAAFLQDKATNITLCNTSKEGRVNSVFDEDNIIKTLEGEFKEYIVRPTSTRNWYDFMLQLQNDNIPCNIKVSKGGTNNALCKKALVYTFSTLQDDEIPANMSFNKMIELIEQNKRQERSHDCTKEYFYIYVDKIDHTIIVRSLCDIQHYVPSAQNWLQINWDKEKKVNSENIQHENLQDSYIRIRSVLRESLEKINSTCNML